MEFIARYSFLFKSPQRGVQGCENQIEQGGSIMASYQTKDIRNIALMGHGSEGKTTLMEALLFAAGAIDRQGRVEDGNTVTDYDAEAVSYTHRDVYKRQLYSRAAFRAAAPLHPSRRSKRGRPWGAPAPQ